VAAQGPLPLLQLLHQRTQQAERLANQGGAAGERTVLASAPARYHPRPKGRAMKLLLTALKEAGFGFKSTSFDAIELDAEIDWSDEASIREHISRMVFIEIKTANSARVQPGFSGYFFAITEGEMEAAEALGERHKVLLYNARTEEQLLTSVSALLARARSKTWQLSIQL
jgi:hypothetical protein